MAKVMINVWLMQEHEHLIRNVILPEFNKYYPYIDVILTTTSWQFLWDKVVMFSKKKQGPDVLQIGNTWNGILAQMGALKDISDLVNKMGGTGIFVPAAARLCTFPQTIKVYSLPWYLDVRAFYYRRDIFEKNGINVHDLESISGLEKVCQKIHNYKLEGKTIAALGISGGKDAQLLHMVAPWIWNFNGEFLSSDEKKIYFNQPKSLAGLEAFFNLVNKYCLPQTVLQSYESLIESFARNGDCSIISSGPWLINTYLNPKHKAYSKLSSNIVPVLTPGGLSRRYTFLGGSNLAISAFSRHPEEAWLFMNFLLQRNMQEKFCATNNQLPSLCTCYAGNLMYPDTIKIFWESIRYGKSFPNSPYWAQIEDVLIEYLHRILVSIHEKTYSVELLRETMDQAARKSELILKGEI